MSRWLSVPWFFVALLVFISCSQSARPTPHDTYKVHLPSPTASPLADANATALAKAIVHDIYATEACKYGNPGCDPSAIQRIRAVTDRWKVDTGCTLQEIRIGATGEKTSDKLRHSGDARATLFRDGEGIEAAVVIIPTEPGIVILVPPLGKPATFFGIVLVADCSLHPKPGLGDG